MSGTRWPDPDRAAILAPNHTGWLDGPVLAALTPRPILFGVTPEFSRHRIWRPMLLGWARLVGTGCTMVPMEPGSHHGLRPLLRHLRGGGWVCLFPEGGIGTGRQYPGAEWLSERTGAPLHRLHIRATGIGKLRLPWRITAV